jgi:molecular chaperone HtpG
LIEKDIQIESVLSEDESKTVKELFDKAIDKSSMNVEVTGLSPDEMPVTVTMDEFMRRMKDMSKMGGGGMMGFYGNLPDNYKVSVNGNHKLIKRMLETKDEDTQKRLARQAFDLALLSQGMLTGADLTAFVARSVDLID